VVALQHQHAAVRQRDDRRGADRAALIGRAEIVRRAGNAIVDVVAIFQAIDILPGRFTGRHVIFDDADVPAAAAVIHIAFVDQRVLQDRIGLRAIGRESQALETAIILTAGGDGRAAIHIVGAARAGGHEIGRHLEIAHEGAQFVKFIDRGAIFVGDEEMAIVHPHQSLGIERDAELADVIVEAGRVETVEIAVGRHGEAVDRLAGLQVEDDGVHQIEAGDRAGQRIMREAELLDARGIIQQAAARTAIGHAEIGAARRIKDEVRAETAEAIAVHAGREAGQVGTVGDLKIIDQLNGLSRSSDAQAKRGREKQIAHDISPQVDDKKSCWGTWTRSGTRRLQYG
jgi:hypothetical protein